MAAPKLVFDFTDEDANARRLVFRDPQVVVTTDDPAAVRACLQEVENHTAEGSCAAGYLAYEAAAAFDPAMRVKSPGKSPLLWFGIFPEPEELKSAPAPPVARGYDVSAWQPDTSSMAYRQGIDRIHQAIAAGETYQLNYTMRLNASFEGSRFALYDDLRAAQQSNYCAFLDIGTHCIISASPELFFRISQGRLTTKPMKGTMRRGRWLEEDQQYSDALLGSEKDRAEHVMIVDLLRNDVGRISEHGTVDVSSLFDVERYGTFLTMTSTIRGSLKTGTTLTRVFEALFPCGSVTGAPKLSTMNLIRQLERSPRQVYCGAIGYVLPNSEAVFSVPIRTILLDAHTNRAEYGVGGGIVWDSTAPGEYEEAMLKASFLTQKRPAFDLFETLKLSKDHYGLLDLHLDRLAKSAAFFGFPFEIDEAANLLASCAKRSAGRDLRVKLILDRAGALRIESQPLGTFKHKLRVKLADFPVDSDDIFLFHKTTHRDVYDRHLDSRTSEEFDDVLLWNENSELTEFTRGNAVFEIGGHKVTPERDCGLLQGTFAKKLENEGIVLPSRVAVDDLADTTRIWFINSVREWVEVDLALKAVPSSPSGERSQVPRTER